MAKLGLAQLTASEVGSVEYVAIAAETGVDSVSLFVCQVNPKSQFPLTTRDNCAAVKERLNDGGLQVANVECFVLTPDVDVENYRSAIELGAELGAQRATTLLYDPDATRVIDNLSRMCELTGEYGLAPGEGKFPIQEFLRALPAGTLLELEVPQPVDVPARERVKRIVEATRKQIELAGI